LQSELRITSQPGSANSIHSAIEHQTQLAAE
jgi:hypothetical protein